MPTQPPPQPSAPELSAKPAPPSAGAPPSGPDAAAKPVREDTLFHLLVESGWDARLAYTADQRIRAMTSETVATGLQPVLAELRQMRKSMATKADLGDLRREFTEFRADLRREAAERETRLIKWMFGALLAQTAVIVGFVTLLR